MKDVVHRGDKTTFGEKNLQVGVLFMYIGLHILKMHLYMEKHQTLELHCFMIK